MRYFRFSRHGLSWLALIAFAGQIILNLGHVHGLDHEIARAQIEEMDELPSHYREAPADAEHREIPEDSDDLDLSCAVCRMMAQAESSIIPSPLPIRIKRTQTSFLPIFSAGAFSTAENASPFASRAPPLTST